MKAAVHKHRQPERDLFVNSTSRLKHGQLIVIDGGSGPRVSISNAAMATVFWDSEEIVLIDSDVNKDLSQVECQGPGPGLFLKDKDKTNITVD